MLEVGCKMAAAAVEIVEDRGIDHTCTGLLEGLDPRRWGKGKSVEVEMEGSASALCSVVTPLARVLPVSARLRGARQAGRGWYHPHFEPFDLVLVFCESSRLVLPGPLRRAVVSPPMCLPVGSAAVDMPGLRCRFAAERIMKSLLGT